MSRRPFALIALSVLLAGSPMRSEPSSFLSNLWESLARLVPVFASSEAMAAAPNAPEPADSGNSPDLGIGMDPDG
jgi:hypothetical protein